MSKNWKFAIQDTAPGDSELWEQRETKPSPPIIYG